MSWVEGLNNDVDYNSQILDGEYNFDSVMWLLSDVQNGKEKMDEYLLSEQDFKQYFEWNNFYRQANIWNCWIVAALDSITHLSNYKNLVRTSVKKTSTWFDIRLPMWAPKSYEWAKWYHTKVGCNKQLQTDGTTLKLLDFNPIKPEDNKTEYEKKEKELDNQPRHAWVWLGCMVHALGQSITGQRNFNYWDLTYWPTGSVLPFQELVYWLASDTMYYLGPDKRGNGITLHLKKQLENFDPKKQTMTAILKTDDDYNIMDDHNSFVSLLPGRTPDHVVSIDHTENIGGTLRVYISDPHDASDNTKIKKYSFKQFVKMIWWYSFTEFNEERYLEDSVLRPVQRFWTKHLALWRAAGHWNETIQWVVEWSWSLWDPVSWRNVCGSRGTVLIEDLNKKSGIGKKNDIQVTWWWKKAVIVDNWTKVKMQITWKAPVLELDNKCFDNKYDENWNLTDYYYYDAACRMTLFLERMSTEYKNNWSSKTPFYLNESWDINFHVKTDDNSTYLWDLVESAYRTINPLTLLSGSGWSNLWLKDNRETKQKVVDFLNKIYGS